MLCRKKSSQLVSSSSSLCVLHCRKKEIESRRRRKGQLRDAESMALGWFQPTLVHSLLHRPQNEDFLFSFAHSSAPISIYLSETSHCECFPLLSFFLFFFVCAEQRRRAEEAQHTIYSGLMAAMPSFFFHVRLSTGACNVCEPLFSDKQQELQAVARFENDSNIQTCTRRSQRRQIDKNERGGNMGLLVSWHVLCIILEKRNNNEGKRSWWVKGATNFITSNGAKVFWATLVCFCH